MTTGQRIAAKRKEQDLSQERLGELLGVSRQSIYKWESDTSLPDIDKLVALSRLFGVPVGWLLGVEEEAPQEGETLSEEQLRMVEEILRRYQQPQQELSEEQRRQVEELVSQGAAGKGRSPRRWPVRIFFVLCLAMAVGMFLVNSKVDDFQERYYNLANSIQNVTYSVNSQIGSLTGRVEEILKAQNSLTADYTAQLAESDLANNTATFQLRVVPKTYLEGMEVLFRADCGAGTLEEMGQPGEDQAFTARLTCPLTDSISLYAIFVDGDTRQTQLLDNFSGLYTASLPDVSLRSYGRLWSLDAGEDGTFPLSKITVELSWGNSSPPPYDGLGQSELSRARVGLFRNQKLVCWLEEGVSDVLIQDSSVSVQAEGEEALRSFRLPDLSLEAEEGDTLYFAALVTDQYGRTFMALDMPGYRASQGELEYNLNDEVSTDPADWTF